MYNDHLGSERLLANVTSPELQPGVATLDLGNFAYARDVQATVLSVTDPMKRNTFNSPNAVRPVDGTLRCSGVCRIELPADSVAVVTFRKRDHAARSVHTHVAAPLASLGRTAESSRAVTRHGGTERFNANGVLMIPRIPTSPQ